MVKQLSEIESLGRYKLLHELGRGGMSVVYLANDTQLTRDVAIKCVSTLESSGTRLVDHLRSEAKLLAQLNHSNIVQLYDVVEQDDTLGLVIEYVGGQTLTQRLKQNPDKATKLKWLAEIAEGLSMAHTKGIAHCDLKAENILVSSDNTAKIADFGIAKVKLDDYLDDDKFTKVGNISGSYFSLSPEQATGGAVDSRTDLFSFAILIYQSLIGEHPFGDTHNKIALLQRIINDPISMTDSAQAELGPRLVELISNLVSKNPEERLYNAEEAAELIRSELNSVKRYATDNSTVEIPTQKVSGDTKPEMSQEPKKGSLRKNLFLIGLGFAVGLGLLKFYDHYLTPEVGVHYVALDKIEIETSDDFNSEILPLMESVFIESAEQALLSLTGTSLIPSKEFQSIEGNYLKRAKATGLDSIVKIKAMCSISKCDIRLRKFSGLKMAVTEQKSWPMAVQFMTGIRSSVADEISNLYPSLKSQRSNKAVSEENYRQYLDVFLSSDNGKSSALAHLSTLEGLVTKQPFFTPAYSLASRVTEVLHSRTQSDAPLEILERILAQVPRNLNHDPQILNAKISLKLLQEKPDEAKQLFELAQQVISDDATLINLETDLAFYGNQPDRLLELDKKNVTLRPSARAFYNLAHSEYSFGNYEAAEQALNNALSLYPEHSFAQDLKGSISMKRGDLDSAIQRYSSVIKLNPNSRTYSNLGLAHMLNGEYDKAIGFITRSRTLSPSKTGYILNLADAYHLSGQTALAQSLYQKVIDLTSQPVKASDFKHRPQALAHTGDFMGAIKTLNAANKKYPNLANLKYSAALVYTLANDDIAAIVAVEEALDLGTGKIWFSLPWFKPLCSSALFVEMTSPETASLCE